MRRFTLALTLVGLAALVFGTGTALGFHEPPSGGSSPVAQVDWGYYNKGRDCWVKMEKHVVDITRASSSSSLAAYRKEAKQFKTWATKCLKQLKKKEAVTSNGMIGDKRLENAFKKFKQAACKYQAAGKAQKNGKPRKAAKLTRQANKALKVARKRVTKSDNAFRGTP